MKPNRIALAFAAMPLCLWGVAQLRVPVDPAARKDAELAARSSAGEEAYRRWLEFYPNEPLVQAAIYRAIALLDTANAARFEAMAKQLDPAIDEKAAGLPAVPKVIGQALQTIQTNGVRHAMPSLTPIQLQAMRESQDPFPALPVGAPGYQQRPLIQSMPGYAPLPGSLMPQPVQTEVAGNVVTVQFGPPTPNSQTPPSQPPQGTSQAVPPMMQQPAMPQAVSSPVPYPPQPAPYAAPPSYSSHVANANPVRVFHDHSRLGDPEYFGPTCGALVVAGDGNLTFTPSGGETALVIPAAEIVEIRLNTVVGKDAGAFHVLTRKGLYLHLAPEAATPDAGRADIEKLLRRLGLGQ